MCFDTLQSFFHLNLHTLVSSLGTPQAGLVKNWVNTELIIWLLSYPWLAEMLVLPLSQCHSQSSLCYILEFHVEKQAKLWTKTKVKKREEFLHNTKTGAARKKRKSRGPEKAEDRRWWVSEGNPHSETDTETLFEKMKGCFNWVSDACLILFSY